MNLEFTLLSQDFEKFELDLFKSIKQAKVELIPTPKPCFLGQLSGAKKDSDYLVQVIENNHDVSYIGKVYRTTHGFKFIIEDCPLVSPVREILDNYLYSN